MRHRGTTAKTTAGRAIAAAALVVSLLALGGCGSTQTAFYGVYEPYAGTALDTYIMRHTDSGWERFARAVDWPFSLVVDSALLPVTVLLGEESEY